jgi:hypothetical protein
MPPEQFRTRDCVVLVKGDTYPATVGDALAVTGWLGGQGVRWVASNKDDFLVGPTDGQYGGFLLWGSDESSDQYTAMTRNQPSYRFAVFCTGGWILMTSTYERYTYASRQSGPLVLITYSPNDKLRFSLRGYWTNEDEWTLSGDPRAPNTTIVGFVVQAPAVVTQNYLTLQSIL